MFMGNIFKFLAGKLGKKSEVEIHSQPSLLETVDKSSHKITEKTDMIDASMLHDILHNFVSNTANVQGAALVSPDGLALASVLPIEMDEDRTAAMSAAMLSLGERIGNELARGNITRIVVEGEKGYGIMVGCGPEAVLLILSSPEVKQGLLFLEIKRIVAQIAPIVAES
ncbi:MAG: roadblock/LC7 domain-containing protein [Calothrix sp. MO_192.B10]|nr:roadblock/LC7 domain-containing protein [Calothrix sp. MO_192.B10]